MLQQLSLRETHFIIKTIEKLRFFIGILLEDLRLKEIDYSTEVFYLWLKLKKEKIWRFE